MAPLIVLILKANVTALKEQFCWRIKTFGIDTDLKIILLDYQNNFAKILSVMSDVAKCFDILAINFVILIVLIFQQNYFSDLYL